MPTISSAGIGSGLDVEGIIKGLVGVERQPIVKLQEQAKGFQTKLSAVGQLQGQLSTLRDAARKLTDASTWNAVTAASSDTTALGVTAGIGAIASSYQVHVTRLASAQQLASANFPAGGSSTVGSGTLTIELGSWNADQSAFSAKAGASPVSVTISPSENSLEAIRDKVNAAGSAVIASIVTDANGARLTLRSRETGAENGFRITAVDDDGNHNDVAGLSALAFDPASGVSSLALNQPAANAALTINGLALSSKSNALDNTVDGLSLQLRKTTAAPVDVTVATDTETLKKAVTGFAEAYNTLVTQLRSQTRFDEATKAAGPLQGDAAISGLLGRLRGLAGASSSGSTSLQRLTDIGLQPQRDGTLLVSASKLDAALANPQEVRKLFASVDANAPLASGIAVQLRSFADALLGSDGAIDAKQDSLNARLRANQNQQERLEDRVAATEKRLRAQYTALDQRMGSLSGLSSYVGQQMSLLGKMFGSSN